jgi:hypothetical protein
MDSDQQLKTWQRIYMGVVVALEPVAAQEIHVAAAPATVHSLRIAHQPLFPQHHHQQQRQRPLLL